MSTERAEVVVVGAGPAGSAAAALLAELGVPVIVLERARFPRPKPCAEYLSPEAGRVLARLGVLSTLEREGAAKLVGMRIVSPDGTAVVGRFAALPGYRGFAPWGLALPRETLDLHLARAAAGRGADVREEVLVEAIHWEHHVPLLRWRSRNATGSLRPRLVLAADGVHSRVARALGVARRRGPRRIAFVTHFDRVADMSDLGEMHVGPTGYVGLAPVGGGVTNVALVTTTPPQGASIAARLAGALRDYPAVQDRLAAGRRIGPVRAVGPFGHWSVRARGDGVLLAGDAADFYDPFTGEGIYAALRGAELASAHAVRALDTGRLLEADLGPYDRERRRTFASKWLVERVIGQVLARPTLFDRVAHRLAKGRHLADLLVGITGDSVPARWALRPSILWQLVR